MRILKGIAVFGAWVERDAGEERAEKPVRKHALLRLSSRNWAFKDLHSNGNGMTNGDRNGNGNGQRVY